MIVFSTYITEGLLSCTYAFPDCRNGSFWKASLLFASKHVYSLKVAKRFGEKKKVRIFAARFGKNRAIPDDNDTDKVIENTERLSTNEVPKQ